MKLSDDDVMSVENHKKRGRPLSFDREAVLEQAMLLFWQYGYEATSISDLTQAMGITAPSLYSAFGDKEQLFLESVQRYQEKEGCPMETIFSNAPTTRIAFELYLQETAIRLTAPTKPQGCMVVTAATNCSKESSRVQQALSARRNQVKQAIRQRLEQGQQSGDLPLHINIDALATYFVAVVQGMTLQARDGASRDDLQAIALLAIAALTH